MTYSVLLRNNPKGGYLATALAWPNFEIEAPTREEALTQMRTTIANLLSKGEIVELEIPTGQSILPSTRKYPSAYTATFGMFRDDPTFSEFVEEKKLQQQNQT